MNFTYTLVAGWNVNISSLFLIVNADLMHLQWEINIWKLALLYLFCCYLCVFWSTAKTVCIQMMSHSCQTCGDAVMMPVFAVCLKIIRRNYSWRALCIISLSSFSDLYKVVRAFLSISFSTQSSWASFKPWNWLSPTLALLEYSGYNITVYTTGHYSPPWLYCYLIDIKVSQ